MEMELLTNLRVDAALTSLTGFVIRPRTLSTEEV
jgi:hypothetical protein